MSRLSSFVTFASLVQDGLLEIGDGYRAKLEELGGDGPIFLRAGSMTTKGFEWESCERFRADSTAKLSTKMGRPADTIITTKGNSVGRTGFVGHDAPEFVYSPHLSYWRSLNPSQLDPRFLHYWSKGPELASQLYAMAHGTDMAPYLSLADQYRLRITLPPPGVQIAIAQILGSLDDRIAVSEMIASTSFELIQARWQFAASKADGTSKVSDLATIEKGLSYKGEALGSGAPLVNLANFGTDGRFKDYQLKFYSGDVGNRHWVRDGDLVMANTDLTQRREILGQPALVATGFGRAIFSHHVFAVRPLMHDEFVALWIYGALRDSSFRRRAMTFATGTTVTSLPRDAVLNHDIPMPLEAERRSWAAVARTLISDANSHMEQNRSASKLRDALLPKMLSGEIEIKDAERLISDAI